MRLIPTLACLALVTARATAQLPAPTEWPAYGRDAGGSRFAPVDQVNRGNVSRLQVAFDSSDAVIAFALP